MANHVEHAQDERWANAYPEAGTPCLVRVNIPDVGAFLLDADSAHALAMDLDAAADDADVENGDMEPADWVDKYLGQL